MRRVAGYRDGGPSHAESPGESSPGESSPGEVAARVCAGCGRPVPAGVFCGCCGAELDRPADRLHLLRPRVFAVAPGEHVATPMVMSSLFPHLPQTSRIPFRIGMVLLLAGLVGCALLRILGPLIVIAALGVPLLFVLYLWQSGLMRDLPGHALVTTAVLGGGLGIAWVLTTGGVLARAYGIPLSAGFVLENLLGVDLVISIGGAILMAVPAIVIRLLIVRTQRSPRESLDGFTIGALGALAFTWASTTTRLAPQFVSGLIDNARPMRLLVESVLYGVAVPLTAAATGGLVGILLWFKPGHRAGEHPGKVRAALLIFSGLVAVIYTAIWAIDAVRLAKLPQLVLHLLMTAAALIAVRVCVQLALLHEEPDPFSEQPLLCVHCERVVPDMAFCTACGAAARASSRASRRIRRQSPPVRENGTTGSDV